MLCLNESYDNHKLEDYYEIHDCFRNGGFSTIFSCSKKGKKDKEYILKLEEITDENSEYSCQNEIKVYRYLWKKNVKNLNIPFVFWNGFYKENIYGIVLNKLGTSIDYVIDTYEDINYYSFLWLAYNMLESVDRLHSLGIYHGDIKPDNFCVNQDKLYIFDFGVSSYLHEKKQNTELIGTYRYASISVHQRNIYHQNDDLESLLYTLFYIRLLNLPWQKYEQDENKDQLILHSKLHDIHECLKKLPVIMKSMYRQLQNKTFKCESILKELKELMKIQEDKTLTWTTKVKAKSFQKLRNVQTNTKKKNSSRL